MEYKIYNGEENHRKKVNKKRIIEIIAILLLVAMIMSVVVVYFQNKEVRKIMDEYVFRKIQKEDNTISIEANIDNKTTVCAFDKYIGLLRNNKLEGYDKNAKKIFELAISITNPIYDTNNKYIAIAEKDGKKLYLVSGQNITWQKDIEGEISKVSINKNGYISVVISETTYKTVIITFDTSGKQVCKTYLSSSYASDVDVSEDNKYLAISEVNTDRTTIQSKIKIISLENNTIVYEKEIESNKIITSIKYNSKNQLVYMYDDGINYIKTDYTTEEAIKFNEADLFSDVNLRQKVLKVSSNQSEIFSSKSEVNIINIENKSTQTYEIETIPREIIVKNETIAINAGTEVHFIDANGLLKKKYIGNQEIKEIVVGNKIAGVVYKNKIDIVSL